MVVVLKFCGNGLVKVRANDLYPRIAVFSPWNARSAWALTNQKKGRQMLAASLSGISDRFDVGGSAACKALAKKGL
jgi:hypothetical protein